MPIYDYQCGSCGHRFELRQSFSAEPEASCPQCSAPSQRRFHAPTVIYKGSGFYTTDYKRKSVSEPGSNGHRSEDSTSPETSGEKKETSTSPSAGE